MDSKIKLHWRIVDLFYGIIGLSLIFIIVFIKLKLN